ncbi:unnamed protein product [Kuraishia capsulata CBS 1993]|uniref:Vps72/YL1 C-terminal domain-containing protein n=1 Tax=Kuraishia capsulata CBS 1993 TaxID=1382522 RepID=W6MMX4_9ASCO|nr:uncharacterized protein KUCA_T00003954001 [Kuraishia capsulata CBS 1993]CDK27974.1 unnamed protein product [Kuraishia capsulata CBS 1993]
MSDPIDLAAISDATTSWQSFKNPNWRAPKRRHKPAKQLIGDEQKRIQSKDPSERDIENEVTYSTLQAPPSLKPIKTYCDITGLPTSYRSPHNQVRYYNMEVYDVVKNLAAGVDQEYLGLRGANVILR